MILRVSLLGLILCAHCICARTFTVVNSCPFTIWPAMFTDLNAGQNVPAFATGWEATSGSSVSFGVPDDWKAGRIWGRRDCDFTTNPGPNSCLDGGCNGGLECDKTTGTGVPPATVAEWTLQGDGNQDFYDVSLVDGYNLPMAITTSANCPNPSCPVDLGPGCPQPLIGPFDSTGFPIGCKSACNANLDGTPTDSANCCSGSHDTAATCPSSQVAFYSYFKGNCPNAYAYAFDESSGTALWECDSSLSADYTLTFCPPNSEAAVAPFVALSTVPSAPASGGVTGTENTVPATTPAATSRPSSATASTINVSTASSGSSQRRYSSQRLRQVLALVSALVIIG